MTDEELLSIALIDIRFGDSHIQSLAVEVIEESGGADTVEELIDILRSDSKFSTIHFVSRSVCKLGPKAVPALVQALSDPARIVRLAALRALRTARAKDATSAIELCLGDPEGAVRAQAVTAMAELAGTPYLPGLITMLADADDQVRAAAVRSLGEIGGAEVVEPLISALDDPAKIPRVEAVKALGQFRDPRSFEPLIAGLSNPHAAADYAKALAEFGDPRAREPIAVLLDDPRKLTREAAKQALARLDQQLQRRAQNLPFLPLPTSRERVEQMRPGLSARAPEMFENHRRAAIEKYRSEVFARGGPLSGPT